MGLDMYLRATKHVSDYEFSDAPDRAAYHRLLEAAGVTKDDIDQSTPSLTISMTVAYWRKANQIHGWFVKNCQDGVDECQDSHVEREQLEELLKLCRDVIKHKDTAAEALPPQIGFFFGTAEIDDYYFEDIEQTITQLERVLGSEKLKAFEFEYHSSW